MCNSLDDLADLLDFRSVTSGTSCDLILRKGKDTDLDEVLNIASEY